MKILVIGGVAGGASAAARIRRLNEQAEIIMFEKDDFVSFSNCALPYYVSGIVSDSKKLVLMTPTAFKKRFNIDVRTNSEVVRIDRTAKKISVKDASGSEYEEDYDKLIIATGAKAIVPKSIIGYDSENVFTIRNVADIVAVKSYAEQHNVKKVTVVGAGFIGLEVAENIKLAGYDVSIVEGLNQVMRPLDYDIVQTLHKEIYDRGVHLYLDKTVTEIKNNEVIVKSSDGATQAIASDMVVLSIGVVPCSDIAVNAGISVDGRKCIKVNSNYQTNDPDIYAVGDVITSFCANTKADGYLALAGPAQRQARMAANHICGQYGSVFGYMGASCTKFFDMNVACVGLNEKDARSAGLSYDSVYVLPPDKVGLMPGSHYMGFKLVFEVPTGRILGAQAIGKGDVVSRINVVATAMRYNGTLEELKDMELCYAPVFSTAKDIVNLAAMVALNVLHGRIKQVQVSEVRELVENGAFIVDVRESNEYDAGHLKGAINIPLTQLRDRMNEIPKDVPVYLHCRTSQRSYYAICALIGNGYNNVVNISGSFLGISLYEYFNDVSQGRTPIVTGYNFA